jgi:hypothetical protein
MGEDRSCAFRESEKEQGRTNEEFLLRLSLDTRGKELLFAHLEELFLLYMLYISSVLLSPD